MHGRCAASHLVNDIVESADTNARSRSAFTINKHFAIFLKLVRPRPTASHTPAACTHKLYTRFLSTPCDQEARGG